MWPLFLSLRNKLIDTVVNIAESNPYVICNFKAITVRSFDINLIFDIIHRSMSLEMELMLPELSLPIQDILGTYCTKILLVRRSWTWSLQLENYAIPDVAHKGWVADCRFTQQ